MTDKCDAKEAERASIMQAYAEQIRAEQEQKSKDEVRACITEKICPVCGKRFVPAVYHIYKDKKKRQVCSYTCARKAGKQ